MNTPNTSEAKLNPANTATPDVLKTDSSQTLYQDHTTLLNSLTEQELQHAVRKKSPAATNLANYWPQPNRDEMEKMYNIALYIHQRFEQIHKLPRHDIDGAICIFLYGVWSIYNQGATIPGSQFTHLVPSVHDAMRERGGFHKAYKRSPKEMRLTLYETLAMVGNWLLVIQHQLASQQDETTYNNVKIMVREIITNSLHIEPESISISQDGRLTISSLPPK